MNCVNNCYETFTCGRGMRPVKFCPCYKALGERSEVYIYIYIKSLKIILVRRLSSRTENNMTLSRLYKPSL